MGLDRSGIIHVFSVENGGLEIAGLESESGLEMGESMALSVLFQKGSIAEKSANLAELSRLRESGRVRL